jgi:hypothetical protein
MTLTIQTSAKPSPIDNCPNEVLDNIISYAIYCDEDIEYVDDGERVRLRPMVALMHVSRRFRAAVLYHEVWQHEDFCLSCLATANRDSNPDNDLERQVQLAGLCQYLLDYPDIMSCLERKTKWTFKYHQVFYEVATCLPSFRNRARAVTLDYHGEGEDGAIPMLGACCNLTELSIYAWHDSSLNFSDIARYLPRLRKLTVDFAELFTGSLETLSKLEEFSFSHHRAITESYESIPFLPFASATTLTRLSICLGSFDFHFYSPTLEKFTNLKHLTTKDDPVHAELVEILKDIPADLESLETSVFIEDERYLDEHIYSADVDSGRFLLDCRCLRHLKTIHLSVLCESADQDDPHCYSIYPRHDNFPSYYVPNCMKIVEKMVKRVCFLEEVELWAGLDLERAPHLLSRLENLKRLRWVIPSERYIQGMKEGQDLNDLFRNVFQAQGKEVDVKVEVIEWDVSGYSGSHW